MKARLTDKWIYIIAVLNSFFLITKFGVDIEPDTPSYINAWDQSWSIGVIDSFRTPIYPCILGLIKTIFSSQYLLVTIIFQHIVFLISIYYLQRILSWKVKSSSTVKWLTLIYALLPATSTWANCILTESLAISGTIFLFYNLFAFQQNNRISNVIWVSIWLLILVMLRPSFLYLFPAAIIAWLIYYRSSKKHVIIGIIGVCIVGFIEFLYFSAYKEKYGLFGPSSVGTINQTYIAIQNGFINPSYTNNPDLSHDIANFTDQHKQQYSTTGKIEFNETWEFVHYLFNKYDIGDINDLIKSSQKTLSKDWMNNIISRLVDSFNEPLLRANNGPVRIKLFFAINMNLLYIFLIINTIVLTCRTYKTRLLFKTSIILLITVLGNLFTIIIGAQDAWGRLFLPSLPLILIMIGQAFNYIKFDFNGTTKETDIE